MKTIYYEEIREEIIWNK